MSVNSRAKIKARKKSLHSRNGRKFHSSFANKVGGFFKTFVSPGRFGGAPRPLSGKAKAARIAARPKYSQRRLRQKIEAA